MRGLNKISSWLPVAIAIGAVALFLGLFKKLGEFFGDKSEAQQKKDVDAMPAPNTANMSFDTGRALALANRLDAAFHPYGYLPYDTDGTDTDEVFRVFTEIKTRDDMRAVYRAFGIRQYHKWGIVDSGYDLTHTLEKELSSSEYSKIKSKINLL